MHLHTVRLGKLSSCTEPHSRDGLSLCYFAEPRSSKAERVQPTRLFNFKLVSGQCRAVTRCSVTRYPPQQGVGVLQFSTTQRKKEKKKTCAVKRIQLSFSVKAGLHLSNNPIHHLLSLDVLFCHRFVEKFTFSAPTEKIEE